MSKVATIAAVTLGGAGLFTASYIGFGKAVGAPMHELAVVGKLFEDPNLDVIRGREEPPVEPEPDPAEQRRQMLEKLRAPKNTASIVDLITVQAPYSTDELKDLVQELEGSLDRLELRERAAAEREDVIERRQAKLDEDFATLIRLQQTMDTWASELRQREAELDRDAGARSQEETQIRSRIGELFLEGDPEELVPRLTLFEPKEAAAVLVTLPPDRANTLLNAMQDTDRWKEYAQAYAVERAKASTR